MYAACIFDLDGTIINTLHSISHTVSMTMEAFGYRPVDEEHTRIFVGDGAGKLIERALIWQGEDALAHYEEVKALYDENFEKTCTWRIEAYDGMEELIHFLKERGIRLGVVTNKAHERALECVEKVYGPGVFDSVIGEGMEWKDPASGTLCRIDRCKPDPAGALLTARRFGKKPWECLYFGDTNTDMRTGINAGMDTVGVTWGFRDRGELEEFHPKYMIDRPGEIKKVFE